MNIRKWLLGLLLLGTMSTTWGQSGSIGFHTTVNEYDGDLSGNQHKYYKFDHVKFGGGISLQQYLNSSFNLAEMATYNFVQYQNSTKTAGIDANFASLNLSLRYKFNNGYIFKENSAIAPFLTAGLGATYINSKNFATDNTATIYSGVVKGNMALGGGILFQFNDRVGLELASTFQMPFDDGWDGVTSGNNDVYLQHSAGLMFNLKKPRDTDGDNVPDRKDKCPETPAGVSVDENGCPVDRDKDGVVDYLDKCPTESGLIELSGCPDKDKDGVADNADKCPEVSGLSRFGGCPDSDGDGIQDSEDKCPNIKGLDIYKGCPDTDGDGVEDSLDKCQDTLPGVKVDSFGCTADTDGDGVADVDDNCPNVAGVVVNKGCPELQPEVKQLFQKALQGIQFETGKAVIKPVSFPILDAITKVMSDNPSYKMSIGGHTDDSGSDATNLTLSQNRADAVANYLIGKGVSPERISAKGYGESAPVNSNKTAAGRTRNRRVEFSVEYLK